MMGPGGCPCKGCKDREQGCHGRCERYSAWQERNAKVKHWLMQMDMAENYLANSAMKTKLRVWRNDRRGGR